MSRSTLASQGLAKNSNFIGRAGGPAEFSSCLNFHGLRLTEARSSPGWSTHF